MPTPFNTLKLVYLGIDTQKENVVFMRKDCHICKSEGFQAHNRILVTANNNSIIATLLIITDGIIKNGTAGLSDSAFKDLNAKEVIPCNTIPHESNKIDISDLLLS